MVLRLFSLLKLKHDSRRLLSDVSSTRETSGAETERRLVQTARGEKHERNGNRANTTDSRS